MNVRTILIALLSLSAAPRYGGAESKLTELATQAFSSDINQSATAIAELRTMGPGGLRALLAYRQEQLNGKIIRSPQESDRMNAAIDAVAMQRDAAVSGLYWYTDFDEAKHAATVAGKPILSLRLLGKLNEELSCANSRFFRTSLYANKEVARYLDEHFVLHWKSVRPVPVITIDFGDGRKLERTITGNSIHYVLDADGRTIDGIPGLYSAKEFLTALDEPRQFAVKNSDTKGDDFVAALRDYHSSRLQAARSAWQRDLIQVRGSARPAISAALDAPAVSDAQAAGRIAVSKSRGEQPLLQAMQLRVPDLATATTDEHWTLIAQLHASESRLDERSRELIRTKHLASPAGADLANRLTTSKMVVEDPMVKVFRNLERSVAEDTVRNEYALHTRIHEWFVDGTAPSALEPLNERIYAELFLTPSTDPWLGLAATDAFAAINGGGLTNP